MKKFKHFIRLTIKAYEIKEISIEEAVDYIVNWTRTKQVFNQWSFFLGMYSGMIFLGIVLWILKLFNI